MRLTDHMVVYNATHSDSVKHLWPKGRAHQALCGDPLQPWGQMRRIEGFALDRESPAADCPSCLAVHAANLANLAHHKQFDRDGSLHIDHVKRVAEAVNDDPLAVVVAYLHDVFADSSFTPTRLIEEHFPPVVIEAVWLVSKADDPDYPTYLAHVGSETGGPEGKLARRVKLAEALDELARAQDDVERVKYHGTAIQVARAMSDFGEITSQGFTAVTEAGRL